MMPSYDDWRFQLPKLYLQVSSSATYIPHVPRGVQILGHCFADDASILRLAEQRNYAGLTTLPGNYSLVVQLADATLLVGSAFGPPNLFYTSRPDGLVHAERVLDVVRAARLGWSWNWRAVADMSSLEHCVAEETLHAEVMKVGPGTVLSHDGKQLSSWRLPWQERVACANPSPQGAVDALVAAASRLAGPEPVVSMSAGFDSRVLLACLLSAGIKPRLITMGAASSTDALVSAAIAKKFALPIERIELGRDDLLNAAGQIVTISGGTKSLQNWHTYLYTKHAHLPSSSRLFIGSNGEAARSYYLDKGVASRAVDIVASRAAKAWFWRRKLRPIFAPDELPMLAQPLAQQFTPEHIEARAQRLCELSPGSLLTGLDQFYTEQRVAQFIANGLALVGAHARPVAPMLDRAWMAQIWNLPRRWKMNSAWHRYAIQRLCPALLGFIEEKTGRPMQPTSQSLYWARRGVASKPVPYVDYRALLREPALLQIAQSSGEALASLARPELIGSVLRRHASGTDKLRAGSFLVTMLHLTQAVA